MSFFKDRDIPRTLGNQPTDSYIGTAGNQPTDSYIGTATDNRLNSMYTGNIGGYYQQRGPWTEYETAKTRQELAECKSALGNTMLMWLNAVADRQACMP